MLSVLILTSFGTGAMASEAVTDQKTISSQNSNNGFLYPDKKTLMENVSAQITQQMEEKEKAAVDTTRSYSLFIGEDKTCTGADYGLADYTVVNGSPDCDYTWGTAYGGYADAAIDVDMVTQKTRGTSWAWVGNRIGVYENNGMTQGSCTVDFDGWVEGSLWQTAYTTGAQVVVWAEIYDLTDDQLVKQFDDWYEQNKITLINDPYNERETVTLEAGHIYDFRMVLYTEAFDLIGTNCICYADCYSGAHGNDGLDYTSIDFNW